MMGEPYPWKIGGYVLAGGQSSRMRRDKALLALAGKPLVLHAVTKLRRVCMDVRVVSGTEELASYAPLVPDLHPGCGPIGGMEAGLTHSAFEWNLFLAVDMLFVPSVLIWKCVDWWLGESYKGPRIRMFRVDQRPQPGLCLLHRDVLPFLSVAIAQGQFKLMPAFETAGRALALARGFHPEEGLWCLPMEGFSTLHRVSPPVSWLEISEAQREAEAMWFANLNTPEEFLEAERWTKALDT